MDGKAWIYEPKNFETLKCVGCNGGFMNKYVVKNTYDDEYIKTMTDLFDK